jgi:hypothetical protein
MNAAKWKMTKANSEWRCEWRGYRLTVREVVAYDGFIDGECVVRMRSSEKTRERLVAEIERNGGGGNERVRRERDDVARPVS